MCFQQNGDTDACVPQTSGYDADSGVIGAPADDVDCDDDADCFPCKT